MREDIFVWQEGAFLNASTQEAEEFLFWQPTQYAAQGSATRWQEQNRCAGATISQFKLTKAQEGFH